MPETPRSTTHTFQPEGSAPDRPANAAGDLKSRLLRLALLPMGATALLGVGLAVFLARADPASGPGWIFAVILGTAVLFAIMVASLAIHSALKIDEELGHGIAAVRRSTVETHFRIWQVLEEMQRRLPAEQRRAVPPPNDFHSGLTTGEAIRLLSFEARQLRALADAVAASDIGAASSAPTESHSGPVRPMTAIEGAAVHPGVGIFVNLARRLQSLVHREIEQLDELENQVEDPDLLKGLFSVDHLATRIRRHAENLAVLGGATSHRQWSRPVNIYEALRSAVAEVEQYARVKLVRPIDGTLKGHAVADVIHLVAELVENATTFSAPSTQVLIRVQRVRAGMAIEVEDRGLGMEQHERDRYNKMLATPDGVDLDALLVDGRIGLYVVASLARRHTLTVQLQSNIFGGTQAVMVVGEDLLGDGAEAPPAAAERPAAAPQPMPAPRTAPADGMPQLPSMQLGGGPSANGRHSRPQPVAGMQAPPNSQYQSAPAYSPAPLPAGGSGYETTETPAISSPSHRSSDPGADNRPMLPRRNKQTHLAPQLRESPQQVARGSEAGHDPQLMKAFQQGAVRADEKDDPQIPSPDSFNTSYSHEEA